MSEVEKLKEDYKDDIIASSEERRKYRMITNADGTVSFVDATEYQQRGTNYGAGDVNKTNIAINLINEDLSNTSDKLKADYIIENYISDNSAMYRKWNSGLLEVWLASTTVVPINIAWGSVFRSDNQIGKNYPEKAKFVAPPVVTMTVKTDRSDVAWITPKDSESTTRLPNYYLVRGQRMDATATYFVNAYAVGRWK